MIGTMEMLVGTEGKVRTGMTEGTTTGREMTAGKETGTGECIGMSKVECKMVSLEGGIQS
jgi:hypothetical protein